MIKRDLLWPFYWLYTQLTRARNAGYRKGIFKAHDLQAPTISIGNITFGGTGKTPLVAFVARVLADEGEKVCVLTRGYGRENPRTRVLVSDGHKIMTDSREAGDEPFELAQKLIGISAVVADANRAEAGKWAREKLGSTAFVLDDAFQHLKVKRDLDLVCVDATNPFGHYKFSSQPILREPLRNLARAHVVVITRANLVTEAEVAALKSQISKLSPQCKIFVSGNKIIGLTRIKEFPAVKKAPDFNCAGGEDKFPGPNDEEQRTKNKYLAFGGLGNPESFFEQLRREGFNLIETKSFRDHHFYTEQDIRNIEKDAVAKGAEVLLTTVKDAVKLSHLRFNFPCYVVESGLIFDDEPALKELIRNPKSKI